MGWVPRDVKTHGAGIARIPTLSPIDEVRDRPSDLICDADDRVT